MNPFRHISLKVFPNAKKEFIEEISPGKLRIFTREPARDNRANKAITRIVAEFYRVPIAKIRIIHGHHAQGKIIEILE